MKLNSKVPKILSKNWQIKILSILFAIVVYASISYFHISTRVVTIPLNLIESSTYEIENLIVNKVDVEIQGNEQVIYLVEPDKLTATLDVSSIKKSGINKIQVALTYSGPDTIKSRVSLSTVPYMIKVLLKERLGD